MSNLIEISFQLNGRAVEARIPAGMSALEMLRGPFDLTGTKYACGEGECGACTIEVDGQTLNACLMFAADCHRRTLTTVEGLAGHDGLSTLQTEFVDKGAVQCGYCTPGLIMQLRQVLKQNPAADEDTIRRGIEGNLCRCTGYVKVVEAALAAAWDSLEARP